MKICPTIKETNGDEKNYCKNCESSLRNIEFQKPKRSINGYTNNTVGELCTERDNKDSEKRKARKSIPIIAIGVLMIAIVTVSVLILICKVGLININQIKTKSDNTKIYRLTVSDNIAINVNVNTEYVEDSVGERSASFVDGKNKYHSIYYNAWEDSAGDYIGKDMEDTFNGLNGSESEEKFFEKRGLYTDKVNGLTVRTGIISYQLDTSDYYTIECTSGTQITVGTTIIAFAVCDKFERIDELSEELYESIHKDSVLKIKDIAVANMKITDTPLISTELQQEDVTEDIKMKPYTIIASDDIAVTVNIRSEYEEYWKEEEESGVGVFFQESRNEDHHLGYIVRISKESIMNEDVAKTYFDNSIVATEGCENVEKRGIYTDKINDITVWTFEYSYQFTSDGDYCLECFSFAQIGDSVSLQIWEHFEKLRDQEINDELYESIHKEAIRRFQDITLTD